MNKQFEVTATTRKKLMDAFWTLYKENNIEKISVSNITRLSGHNRSTFYHYFIDVYDLLEQLETELIEEVNQKLQERLVAFNIDNELLGSSGDPQFTEKLRVRLQENLIGYDLIPADTENLDYIMMYIYSSMIGLLSYWHERGHDLSDDEFIKLAQSLTANGVLGYNKV